MPRREDRRDSGFLPLLVNVNLDQALIDIGKGCQRFGWDGGEFACRGIGLGLRLVAGPRDDDGDGWALQDPGERELRHGCSLWHQRPYLLDGFQRNIQRHAGKGLADIEEFRRCG